ncbi:pilus assembly protein TadG-related protein [Blastococcus sp. HT6-30]|uniref:pilus assembly protein TadG-related protein n=1 Tax=Blastococcus sp. HT6-30 TaxID=3144843 RepID=UPI00321BC104
MQRLTLRRRLRRHEHGASAVLLALLLVPMLGFAAIAVDVGALYAERARLQVAADAAALAVASDCARGNCGDMLGTAQGMVVANVGEATAAQPVLSSNPTSVTVTGSTPKEHWFAPVIGHDASSVSATATVAWGAPERGTAVLPLTFSWCEFLQQTGGGEPSGEIVRTIHFTKSSDTVECTGPSNLIVPGGFAYLDTPPEECEAASARNERSYSSTGNTPPSTCTPAYLNSWVGHTVLLPLFDSSGDTGTNAWYHVFAYAAFHITGFHFGGQFTTGDKPCTGNARCVSGYFTELVDLNDAFSYSPDAPQLGASILRLIR